MRKLKGLIISLLALSIVVGSSTGVTTYAAEGVTSTGGGSTSTDDDSLETRSKAGSAGAGYDSLVEKASKEKGTDGAGWDYSNNQYKQKEGGYYIYEDITKGDKTLIQEAKLGNLTAGAKKDFLTDYYNAGVNVINGKKNDNITEETGTMWLRALQSKEGVGSQLMTTLMAQTKPDYVSANRIYQPFSGPVGTFLGIVSVLLMAFLAMTMVLDLAYIAIPTFQLFVDGENGGGEGGKGKKSFISTEAMEAVQMAQGGQGGSGQSGSSNKLAVSIYFKKRVLMLVVLGICLLYLVSGNIFALVGTLIDLLSGFLGF